MRVALFFTWRAFGAGTTTFTAHLAKGFIDLGIEPRIYRVKARGENCKRAFSKYHGLKYQNVTCAQAVEIAKSMPSLLCSPCPAKHLPEPYILHRLIKAGMRVVIHGLVDYRVHQKLGTVPLIEGAFVIRPALAKLFNSRCARAHYIPHPYVRVKGLDTSKPRHHHAICIARTTFIKNTLMIIEANHRLRKAQQVKLLGTVDRMYVQHKIRKVYPDFEQEYKGFPPSWDFGAQACSDAVYAVDMSDGHINGGGGTQYTFLEAWDGGAVNIINRNWLDDQGEMKEGVNCLAAQTPRELVRRLQECEYEREAEIITNGFKMLKRHDARVVATEYWEHLK